MVSKGVCTKDKAVSKRVRAAHKGGPLMFKRVTFNSFEFARVLAKKKSLVHIVLFQRE